MIDTGMCFNSTQNHRFDIRFSLFKGGLILEGFSSSPLFYPESTNVLSGNYRYFIFLQRKSFYLRKNKCQYSHYSNKRDVTLTNFEKNPPSMFIDFIIKVSDIIAEPNDDFPLCHFEL